MSTRDLVAGDYVLSVTNVRVTIHTLGVVFESDRRSENHASTYHLIGGTDVEGSAQINIVKASPTDTMGTLQRKFCLYETSKTALHNVELRAVQGITVGQVLELLDQKGRGNYKLAPSGVGCRFWVKTMIEDLESAGYIDLSSPAKVSQAYDDLQYSYSKSQDRELDPIIPGVFM
ncbi:hypothetical protein AJ80_08551 [Polytolypa hystricis UAMH7299]|uniref:DUF7770 domain-containing protein n=1 Tax=Polytolypa hystricis (strain UAMH7299) TaxID=1447883 RepID=A0A2B7X568_POLH7|nr:hypothetical protein AJ80_08551 [Polytolypa hystricis UAMH7299]